MHELGLCLAYSKGGAEFLRSKAKQLSDQLENNAQRHSLTASHAHSSPQQLRPLEQRSHTSAFRACLMLTGAPVLCIWGVILDSTLL